jgi:hypothetical protein
MKTPLNSSLEVGVRVLVLLLEAFPIPLDVNRLVLLDHGLLHSADLGGPESLHPPLPIRAGELGMKRRTIEEGLQLMIRAELVEMRSTEGGINYQASDKAYEFVSILTSAYAKSLHVRATWVIAHFENLNEASLREGMRVIADNWSEEFESLNYSITSDGT